jgi:hypothetical protein
MAQNIIVIVIVLVAILFASRRVYRILSNKKVQCGCAVEEDCASCSVSDNIKERDSKGSSNSIPGF